MKQTVLLSFKFIAQYALPFLASLILSLALTPLVRKFALRYKLVSFPRQDRWRRRVVASLGGAAIFGAFLIPYCIFADWNLSTLGFIFGGLAVFWLGVADDIVHIKPDTKLIGQIIAACIVIMFGVRFNIYLSPIVNILLTIFWMVAVMNAFNLLDNMDGLCAGIASISALTLCVYAAMNDNIRLAILSLLILGSGLGFLKYNFNPAKIFMGDCGSMFLGYALAVGALMGSGKESSSLFAAMSVPVFMLAVPIFDTVFVTLSRTMNNRPISEGGKDHTSHRLVILGLSERKAVLLLYFISAVCGLGAIASTRLNFIHIVIFGAIFLIGLFIFGVFLGTEVKVYSQKELDDLKGRRQLNGKVIFNGFVYNKRRIAEVILDFVIISISYISAFLLRFEGPLFALNISLILESLPLILIIKFLSFYFFGLYRGVWRYAGLYDVIAIFKAVTVGSVLSIVALLFLFRFRHYSRTVFVIDWLLTFISASGVRVLFRLYKEFFANIRLGGRRILIFGAGDAGEMTLREIRQNSSLGYKPIGFVDDDADKFDRLIHGVRVLGKGDNLERLVYRHKIEEVLIALPLKTKKRRMEVQEACKRLNIPFKEVSKMLPVEKEGV